MAMLNEKEVVNDDDGLPSFYPQLVALQSKPTAVLSIIGSYVVIREAIRDHQVGGSRGKVILRVLIAISVSDIFFSIPYFLTTWVAPSDVDYEFAWGNVGTQATCSFSATMLQFGFVAGPLFNTCLAWFSLLLVKYNWTDSRLTKIEKWVHGVVWAFAFGAAIFPVPMGLYNYSYDVCWFESEPIGCKDSFLYGDEANCERGDNAWIFGITFQVFPGWTCLLASSIMLVMIYRHVSQIEERVSKWDATRTIYEEQSTQKKTTIDSTDSDPKKNMAATTATTIVPAVDRSKSRAVAERAILYIFAYLFTNVLDLIASILYYRHDYFHHWLDFVTYVIFPMQGIFTFCIFARKRKNMKTPEGRFLRSLVFDWLCCLCSSRTLRTKDEDFRLGKATSNSESNQPCSGNDV